MIRIEFFFFFFFFLGRGGMRGGNLHLRGLCKFSGSVPISVSPIGGLLVGVPDVASGARVR